jgi:hypothetical protein
MGHASASDGGEGVFVYIASHTSSADNGGTVIIDASEHRYHREVNVPFIVVEWFGAKGDASTDDSTAINGAITALEHDSRFNLKRSCSNRNNNQLSDVVASQNAGGGVQIYAGVAALRLSGQAVNNTGVQLALGAPVGSIIDFMTYAASGQTNYSGTPGNNFIRVVNTGVSTAPIVVTMT